MLVVCGGTPRRVGDPTDGSHPKDGTRDSRRSRARMKRERGSDAVKKVSQILQLITAGATRILLPFCLASLGKRTKGYGRGRFPQSLVEMLGCWPFPVLPS